MIKLVNVHKKFGGQKVLDGVTLDIPKGKITVVIGASGVGKSVLLKHMIGLLKPDSGKVFVDGIDLSNLSPVQLVNIRKKFGMLFQGAALLDSLNVFDNVAFPLVEHKKLSPSEIKRIVHEKLELVGLKNIDHKMPSELSGGMRKRVGLARAIILQPETMLYDEPTTGLDPIMTDSVDNLILDMQQKLKITSVVISHDIASAFTVADQIAMLHEGKIVEAGPPQRLKESRDPFVRKFIGV
ncbi:MAG: ABC transporter ATP-binding protein [Deltaproteobacteria bacterium CG11_big_fil_rev_8_21_14_0_20_49_13]|nr:MAG: ABC transporter ATP-binding protein [Deltaproteobacteria bacterium CG11_big_fil_rev_8_21_14_0_20_49_13]